jgi:hypothetical protein
MNKLDFTLDRKENENDHEDYWFKITGNSQKELEKEVWEMCMSGVFRVVYSKDEGIVGVRRDFPFNWDVILSSNEELKNILIELTQ